MLYRIITNYDHTGHQQNICEQKCEPKRSYVPDPRQHC
jgi:hypothetical protein